MDLDDRLKTPPDSGSESRWDSGLSEAGYAEKEHGRSLAMAYVPYQQFGETFGLSEAMTRGTIFPDLYKPFQKGACGNHE